VSARQDEAPAGAAARGFKEQATTDTATVAQRGLDHLAVDQATIRAKLEARDERMVGLRARAALAGFELLVIAADDNTSAFMIQKFGLVRELRDVAAVEAFLDRAAGAMR